MSKLKASLYITNIRVKSFSGVFVGASFYDNLPSFRYWDRKSD